MFNGKRSFAHSIVSEINHRIHFTFSELRIQFVELTGIFGVSPSVVSQYS